MPLFKHLTIVTLTAAALAVIAPAYAQTDATAPLTKKAVRKQNHQLESKVRHALTKTKQLDSSNITILARSGKVTLEGDAPDDQQIQLAGTAAAGVAGVTGVTNNLRVREVGD
jgi:osmotically-inducible protein OsmY